MSKLRRMSVIHKRKPMERRRALPGWPGYSITQSGSVWHNESNKQLHVYTGPGGYDVVDLVDADGKVWAQSVTKLLLNTFIGSERL